MFCLKYLHLFMYSNLWNCSYSLLPIRPPQFCYDEAKLGKQLIFILPLGRVGGGGQIVGETATSPAPDRTCQCIVHMVEGRSFQARAISKHVPTICNAQDRDPRAPNTLAFCFIFFAPLAAPGTYSLPRGMGKHWAGVGGFKEI